MVYIYVQVINQNLSLVGFYDDNAMPLGAMIDHVSFYFTTYR